VGLSRILIYYKVAGAVRGITRCPSEKNSLGEHRMHRERYEPPWRWLGLAISFAIIGIATVPSERTRFWWVPWMLLSAAAAFAFVFAIVTLFNALKEAFSEVRQLFRRSKKGNEEAENVRSSNDP